MTRVNIDTNAFVYPMPMVLVGATVENRPNFMAVGWVSRVNARPPMIGVALGKLTTQTRESLPIKVSVLTFPGWT